MIELEPESRICRKLATEMTDFVWRCAQALDTQILIDGLLPPIVRGHRLGQSGRDGRPHMGGSDAENGAHFASFLAMIRERWGADALENLDQRVLRSIEPYLLRRLVPFPQRAVLQALTVYGPLETNTLWHGLPTGLRQQAETSLFDLSHYYDLAKGRLHTLPSNYFWITAENARLIGQLVQDKDARAEQIFESAFGRLCELLRSSPWFDDHPPQVVVDQYAWETVAAAVDLCQKTGRTDDLAYLLPIAQRYMDLLRDLVREDGYALCWGRSLGIISYGTTISFMLSVGRALYEHGLATAAAWKCDLEAAAKAFATLSEAWFDDDGLTTMHKFGRETYSYRRAHRLVGSTLAMLVKFMHYANELEAIEATHGPALKETDSIVENILVNRFELFRRPDETASGRYYGLWVGKTADWHLCLPVTGCNPESEPSVSSSYLPAPLMPFWLDVPVQQSGPYGTQFVELADGSVWSASGGCDHVEHNGTELALTWSRFTNIKTAELRDDIGELTMHYNLDGSTFHWQQVFSTERNDITSRYGLLGVALEHCEQLGGQRYRFTDERKRRPRHLRLDVLGQVRKVNVEDVDDLPAGKGYLGAIPWVVTVHLPLTSGRHELHLVRRQG